MYDAGTRDRYRVLVTAVTGVAAVASATAVGVLTGVAAKATVDEGAAAAPPAPEAQRQRPVVRWKERPRRTVVETRTVFEAGTGGVGGGTVTPTTSGGSSGGGSGSGGSGSGGSSGGGSGGSSGPSTPAPPPPAPSSGS